MNFEEIRDRKLKIITTQMLNLDSGPASGATQSSAFNASTKAIIIRASNQNDSSMYMHFKIGSNPTASSVDFFMVPRVGGQIGDIFTFNVEPGQQISIKATGSSNIGANVHIIELG